MGGETARPPDPPDPNVPDNQPIFRIFANTGKLWRPGCGLQKEPNRLRSTTHLWRQIMIGSETRQFSPAGVGDFHNYQIPQGRTNSFGDMETDGGHPEWQGFRSLTQIEMVEIQLVDYRIHQNSQF